VSHRFATTEKGYRGWAWDVTVDRAPGSDDVTVAEIVLLPGEGALLPPPWVPWSERLRPGDLGVGDLLPTSADDDRHRFLVRTVDPPEGPVPPQTTLLLDRGPYTLDGERALLREYGVGLLVTKNSGGSMTAAKLQAARELSVLVVMVQRPPLPEGSEVVATVADALAWIIRSGSGAG